MTKKKNKDDESVAQPQKSAIIEEAKKTLKRKKASMRYKQKVVAELNAPPPQQDLEQMCMADIYAHLKRVHEEAKGKAFQLRLQNKKNATTLGKTTGITRIVKHIITSKGLLEAIKTKPEFAEGILKHFKKELDIIAGEMVSQMNVIKEFTAENAQQRAANVILMNRNKAAEEQLINVIHKHQNAPFANATALHSVFSNATPINPFIGPSYKGPGSKSFKKKQKQSKPKHDNPLSEEPDKT